MGLLKHLMGFSRIFSAGSLKSRSRKRKFIFPNNGDINSPDIIFGTSHVMMAHFSYNLNHDMRY